jgi:hypothetical protein
LSSSSVTVALFLAASSLIATTAANEGPNWTFMCKRDGHYGNGVCKTLDATLWDEVTNCIAAVASVAEESSMNVDNRLGLRWDHGSAQRKVQGGLFADVQGDIGDAKEQDRRGLVSFCFAKGVNCNYWSYPHSVCCRSNPSICVSSTKNPCKRRRMNSTRNPRQRRRAEAVVENSGGDDEYFPYAAEMAAIEEACTAKLQGICHEVDTEGSGRECLGNCELLQCGGYMSE